MNYYRSATLEAIPKIVDKVKKGLMGIELMLPQRLDTMNTRDVFRPMVGKGYSILFPSSCY